MSRKKARFFLIVTGLLTAALLVPQITRAGPTQYTLTTGVVGSGSVDPAGGTYNKNAWPQITAIPDAGWSFDHWEVVSGYSVVEDIYANPSNISIKSDTHLVAVLVGGGGPTPTPEPTATPGPTATPDPTATPGPTPTPTPSGDWQLVWSDEFDGPNIDTSVWNFDIGDGGKSARGWWNDELEWYTDQPENVRIENGALIIEARHEFNGEQCWYGPCEYTSAKITTKNKLSFQYGRIEARMILPYGNGMWPAFWTMGDNFDTASWPRCGELDIMEMVGGDQCGFDCADNMTHGYMHFKYHGTTSYGTNSPPLAEGIYADDYHVFAIEWDAQEIKWFVDDQMFFSHTIDGSEYSEFHQPHWMMINLAVGGEWGGNPTPETVFPQMMYVDWVRVWQK